jgi:hypothetical protein
MQVFCNLLQIIKGLPFNPWLVHILQFVLYIPSKFKFKYIVYYSKNTIKSCNYTEKKSPHVLYN